MNYVPDTTIKEMFWTGDSRLNRLRFLKRNLALMGFVFITLFAIFFALGITSHFAKMTDELLIQHPAILISTVILQIFSTIICYKLDVRRLKDIGRGKPLAVIKLIIGLIGAEFYIVSVVSIVISIYLLFAPGDKGPNMYGPDPLGNIENTAA